MYSPLTPLLRMRALAGLRPSYAMLLLWMAPVRLTGPEVAALLLPLVPAPHGVHARFSEAGPRVGAVVPHGDLIRSASCRMVSYVSAQTAT